jgi:hypothetical protein
MNELLLVCRFGLAFIFLAAGSRKLVGAEELRDVVREYKLLPERAAGGVARALPWAELSVGLCLLLGITTSWAAAVAGGLSLSFAFAMGINLVRGVQNRCGCGLTNGERTIGWPLCARNVGLSVAACLVANRPQAALAVAHPGGAPDGPSQADALALAATTGLLLVSLAVLTTIRETSRQRSESGR